MARIFLILCFALILLFNVSLATEVDIEKSMVTLLSNLPSILPFIMAKVKTPACKKDLKDFAENMRTTPEALKDTAEGVKLSICKIKSECIEELMSQVKELVSTGGFVEKMARTFLKKANIELEEADTMMGAYLEMTCSDFAASRPSAEEL
jgi:hypothetical protein